MMTPSVLTQLVKEKETLLTLIAILELKIKRTGMEMMTQEALDWKKNPPNTLMVIKAKLSISSPPSNDL